MYDWVFVLQGQIRNELEAHRGSDLWSYIAALSVSETLGTGSRSVRLRVHITSRCFLTKVRIILKLLPKFWANFFHPRKF